MSVNSPAAISRVCCWGGPEDLLTWRISSRAIILSLVGVLLQLVAGCSPTEESASSQIIGRRGVDNGHFSKPRAIEINSQDEIFVVDMTGRIQVLTNHGEFRRSWRTPEIANGKPCGLGFSNDGLLMVADTHYFRILFYQPDGTPVPERTIGGVNGRGPGEFGFVTDAVQDRAGNYYVSEYGDFDRLQKFDSKGEFICQWGGHGTEPGQFLRPQAMAIDRAGQLWVADSCNHRLQIFNLEVTPPRLVKTIGSEGTAPGQLRYPYGLWLDTVTTFWSPSLETIGFRSSARKARALLVLARPVGLLGSFTSPGRYAAIPRGS